MTMAAFITAIVISFYRDKKQSEKRKKEYSEQFK